MGTRAVDRGLADGLFECKRQLHLIEATGRDAGMAPTLAARSA